MFKEGSIIEGPFWPEPVEVKRVSERSIGFHIIGSTIYSNTHVDQIITKDDLKKVKIRDFLLTFSSSAEEVFLALEGLRYHYVSPFDPFLAMNVSKIDPLPFQIDAVYGYVLKLPKIRFLIADDPGAGKTIMAGLIIKELKLRGVINRILIVVPGHLKDQWRRELKEKFQETFTVATRQLIDAHYCENIWERENQIITSMDFAKQEEIIATLSNVHWDLVIVDEAHKMAAYSYTGSVKKTDRYQLGELLSKNTKHFLFLTATPHKGDPENYRLLLDLLEPGFFATAQMVKDSIEKRENPLFIRRLKEDLKDFNGKPIFTNRYAKTVKFRLSEPEKRLYNALSAFSGAGQRGATVNEMKLSASEPAVSSSIIVDTIEKLKENLFYLADEGLFFKNRPNLNRVLIDKMESISDDKIENSERDLLESDIKDSFDNYLWPQNSRDIPDTPKIKLVILRKENGMKEIYENYGDRPRIYKNTMIFLASEPSERELGLKQS